jgi:hypothetical protein
LIASTATTTTTTTTSSSLDDDDDDDDEDDDKVLFVWFPRLQGRTTHTHKTFATSLTPRIRH